MPVSQTYASTVYFNFTPPQNSAYTFRPTLDGQTYSASVRWNVFGQRYYILLTTLQGVPVLNKPVVGSPNGFDISIVAGYFTSLLVYRTAYQRFEVLGN